jgi:hypothetical protein
VGAGEGNRGPGNRCSVGIEDTTLENPRGFLSGRRSGESEKEDPDRNGVAHPGPCIMSTTWSYVVGMFCADVHGGLTLFIGRENSGDDAAQYQTTVKKSQQIRYRRGGASDSRP